MRNWFPFLQPLRSLCLFLRISSTLLRISSSSLLRCLRQFCCYTRRVCFSIKCRNRMDRFHRLWVSRNSPYHVNGWPKQGLTTTSTVLGSPSDSFDSFRPMFKSIIEHRSSVSSLSNFKFDLVSSLGSCQQPASLLLNAHSLLLLWHWKVLTLRIALCLYSMPLETTLGECGVELVPRLLSDFVLFEWLVSWDQTRLLLNLMAILIGQNCRSVKERHAAPTMHPTAVVIKVGDETYQRYIERRRDYRHRVTA